MADGALIDVLVIGSGAAGLAAGGRGGVCGRPRRGRDEDDPAGLQLGEGPGRHPGVVRRRRQSRAARGGRDALVARHRSARARRVLTSEARGAIAWLEELGCAFTRENGGYRLARCGGATRKRLLQVGDRTGHAITKALREAYEAGDGDRARAPPADRARARRRTAGARRSRRRTARTRSTPRPSSSRRADAASPRPRPAASSRPTIRTRRARRLRSRSTPAPTRATSTRCSTTRTAAPGPRRCRATRSPRRRARTAPCC